MSQNVSRQRQTIRDLLRQALQTFGPEFSNISWLAGDRLFRVMGTLALSILAARLMGPADYGGISYAQTLIGFLTLVTTLGLNSVVVKAVIDRPAEARFVLGTAFLVQMIATSLVFVCVGTWALLTENGGSNYNWLVLIMAIGLVFRPTDTIRYWFESQVHAKYAVVADNVAFIMGATAKIFALYLWRSVDAFAWATVAEQIFSGIFLVNAYRYYHPKPGKWAPRSTWALKLLRDAYPLLLSGAAIAVYMRIDQVVIMSLRGPEETGVYSAATRLSEAFYVVPSIIYTTFFPRFQRLLSESRTRYVTAMNTMMTTMTVICTVVSLFIFVFSYSIVDFIYGSSYITAATVLAVHIWTGVFVSLGILGSQWYLSHGLQSRTLFFTLLGCATNLSINLMLVPIMGAVGAAIASLCAQIVSSFLADCLSNSTRQVFFIKLRALLWPVTLGLRLIRR